MLLGSDGLGGIEFDDAELARKVGVVALAAILFEGGLATSWRRLREVAIPATLLATVGVIVTALLTALAAYALFDLSWLESVLLGAVVSSTDAAAVFATLRFTHIRRRLARTLEAETGGNDPMAIALTIGLIDWIEKPNYGIGDLSLLLLRQLGLGLVIGVALGLVATWAFARLPHSIGAFAPVASIAAGALSFGVADVSGGSGFLAVYLVGLAVGSTPSRYRRQLVAFHEGLAFAAQVALSGLGLAALLVLVIRPVAVWVSTAWGWFNARERALLGWAGLRGAVPIVLGTIVLSEHIDHGKTIFNAVFFVVVVSALAQGTTLEWVAEKLGVVSLAPRASAPPLEVDALGSLDLIDFDVAPDHAIAGAAVRELGLPRTALVAVVARGDETIPPRGSTVIQPGDRLFVLAPHSKRPEIEDVFSRWRRRV